MHFTENGETKHICEEYTSRVKEANSIAELVKLYKAEPSWAMSVHYPSYEVMREFFDNEEARDEGAFVGADVDMVCDNSVYMFNKCSGKVEVTFDKGTFPVLYIGLGSNMIVFVKSPYAEINVYDDSNVEVRTVGSGQCRVFRYGGGEIKTKRGEKATIIDKR